MRLLLSLALLFSFAFGNSISITKGWNLVGFNKDFVVSGSALDNNKTKLVWKYTNNSWSAFSNNESIKQSISGKFTFIENISRTDGVWVYANEDFIVEQSQVAPASFNLDLKKGWNLVSTPNDADINITSYLENPNFKVFFKFESNSWRVATNAAVAIDKFDTIKSTEGFWVLVESDATLQYTYTQPQTTTPDINNTTGDNNSSTTTPDTTTPPSVTGQVYLNKKVLSNSVNIVASDTVPAEPALVPEPAKHYVEGSSLGVHVKSYAKGIRLFWQDNVETRYIYHLYNGSTEIFRGGDTWNQILVDYQKYNLKGDEVLTAEFEEVNTTNTAFIRTVETISIDLSKYKYTQPVLGQSDNRISYTFKDFPADREATYRDFLKKVWPIMTRRLGPPAESFNCVITNMGHDSNYFMIIDDGRTFLSNTNFIPRLIVHEFIHAWKGHYQITTDKDWNYDDKLSGFEESLAEGYAFEIIHEFVKTYPNDSATKQLLSYKPYQYHSVDAVSYDLIKTQRNTGAGAFWTITGSEQYRYSAASITMGNIVREYPDFYKDTQAIIYATINNDNSWRPSRANIMAIWKQVAPTVQGIDLETYLNALPVFNGKPLEDGFYIYDMIRQYGSNRGDFQLAFTYSLKGSEWWNIRSENFNSSNLPTGLKYVVGSDGWVYPDTQFQNYSFDVSTNNSVVLHGNGVTAGHYYDNGNPSGTGWHTPTDLQQTKYAMGMYRLDISFDNFVNYTGAKESFYFFGTKDYNLSTSNTNLMIGIDTNMTDLTMTIDIDGLTAQNKVKNSMGLFTFGDELPKGYETVFNITVASADKTCTYKRALLDASTLWNTAEFFYVIQDKDFNCIEDIYEK